MTATQRKLRAGANIRDPNGSGYARSVDILSQPDLFPNEGYEFKPNTRSKLTNSYKVSEDSPFTSTVPHKMVDKTEEQKVMEQQVPQLIRTERLCTKAAVKAIATPTDGEIRPLHSQIVDQAVFKEREQQRAMNEQIRIARMKDEAKWADDEQREAEATRAFYNRNDNSRRLQQEALRNVYKNEIALHKKRQQDQLALEKKEAEKNAKIQAAEEAKEREIACKKKEEERKRVEEFEKTNGTMLNRKRLRQQQEMEIDRRVQKEHEEIEAKQQAREAVVRKAKEEKNRIRERIIQQQAQRLLEMQKKQDTTLENAVSEITMREEQEREAEIEKRKMLADKRNRDWQQSLKQIEAKKEAARREKMEPAFTTTDNDDFREAEEIQRREKEKRLRAAQLKQIQERKEREARERQEQLNEKADYFFLKESEW